MASADSPSMRRSTWEWWQSVLQTRLEPDGAICVIQTRWNEDDLAGRILADAQADEWKIIDLPALADGDTDPLGRRLGEPLWPERFDAEHHATTRRRVGERVWAALYIGAARGYDGHLYVLDDRSGSMGANE